MQAFLMTEMCVQLRWSEPEHISVSVHELQKCVFNCAVVNLNTSA